MMMNALKQRNIKRVLTKMLKKLKGMFFNSLLQLLCFSSASYLDAFKQRHCGRGALFWIREDTLPSS
jgi:hypothetical protein